MAAVHQLQGVGNAAASLLEKLNIFNTDDLLFHLPRDYEDRSTIIPMNQLSVGRSYLLEGIVKGVDFPPGKRKSMAVLLDDDFGKVTLRFYHIYKGITDRCKLGNRLRIFGEVRVGARGLEMYHPELQVITEDTPLPQTQLTAIYPATEGLTQPKIRDYIQQALAQYSDHLPELLPAKFSNGYALKQALEYIHHPPVNANMLQLAQGSHPAQQRLIFEELVAHQISLLTRRAFIQQVEAPSFAPSKTYAKQLLASLAFEMTGAQKRVSREIVQDLKSNKPMLRLVQGDVGAGKTLVAGVAACHALEEGWQVALMAPTEILAEQHYLNFKRWFEPLGLNVAWLSGKQKGKARAAAEQVIRDGSAHLVIGTHALFQENVEFAKLGLVIIDEQHRFGVDQRLALRNKGLDGMSPHQLVMTATPIPRTLAMSAYGDLDTSVIDELPPGRTPIQTVTIPLDRREEVLQRIASNCAEGKQAYWVCTLVEQSETLDAQAAEATFAEIRERFPALNIGLVHGKMKADEKQAVMQQFKNNELQLLIATTVIEVGVDVPNASIMVIENAERLGLSQLHQLRGRVGRGAKASFCALLYKHPLSQNGQERLRIMRETNDGFMIAEKDLELRGPGELLGTKQTGDMNFRVAKLERDDHLLNQAHYVAQQMLKDYPDQAEALLQRWLPEAPRYAYV
ncbi:ATP-dependent DNA helicase RecG [Acinetobacter lwoffii]|jgi:ATP-dependent DNA helicase RecG|uniref:ATP-dependent DNA helicase RecG n=1 Tax=Acinetobacter lwoffii NCTC 5866 = CIP 64.10 = NIPH 512 TaxID=981327 RepID=A0ABN0PWM0_ACILW|nr:MULTISPECIES: ATP-dependent DNA helicase RecG [Acinetobacter]ENU17861.1 ATP-dependent DNA helicase RecG [Acinetobacter sp. CIP A162]ESJ94842.1 ATP-dependent DNA helicase RecG [Acinetobacter lwoffii NCTC 5866 = CIP 64.10 = NIPH 512]MCO8084789.1 ATP-dependent DNA helicase RecG [Acinetobacter lwoffii]MEB6679084.1 ATP-dependent DNA helicase RecG [Acinetobacter lwoffii]QXB39358.1 ATP-dependent DNA helicase RecG [Acinetobacter lwoffii]